MNTEVESILDSYWHNEKGMIDLAQSNGTTVVQICESPNNFSKELIASLKMMLVKKKELLVMLNNAERKAMLSSSVVNLDSYRRLRQK